MLKRLRKLEVLTRTSRINPNLGRSDEVREFRSRMPQFVPLAEDVEIQIRLVRQCGCGSWVLQGEQACSFCGVQARGGALSKAWEITRFGSVPLVQVANLLSSCGLGTDETSADQEGQTSNVKREEIGS